MSDSLSAKEHTEAHGDKIKGYKKLTDTQLDNINQIKTMGNTVGELIKELELDPDVDKRWLAIAKTDLQKAFMPFVRAIAKPDFF